MSSRKVPYGYKLDSLGRQIPDPATMPHLEQIIEIVVVEGIESPAMLARVLNDEGFPTQRGGKWHASTVGKLLEANRDKIEEATFRKKLEKTKTPRGIFTPPEVVELEMEFKQLQDNGDIKVKKIVHSYTQESADLGKLWGRASEYFKKSKLFHAERAVFFDVMGYDEYEAEDAVNKLHSLLARINDEQLRAELSQWIDATVKNAGQLAQMARMALADREEMKREHAIQLSNLSLWQELAEDAKRILDANNKTAKRARA